MKEKYIMNWDPEEKIASCIIEDSNNIFYGSAWCHPDDQDMGNELTGCNYAMARANIKLLQHKKNNIYRPSLKALKHLQACMNFSSHYNPKSYEARMLQRQINYYENMITITEKAIDDLRKELKTNIDQKDELYKKVRKNKKKAKNN